MESRGEEQQHEGEKVATCSKVICDPIHGHISLHPLCVKIIDTPQFQRLRYLKQLGGCYFVYPGASHNRFEHCIGVAHLARRFAEELRRRQPELGITKKDVLCVEIAGLCHDLGHGPFSHAFDNMFVSEMRPETKWEHEDGSKAMFKHMVKENNLKAEFEKEEFGLTEDDQTFILELIRGVRNRGRGEDKSFLYEIVANNRTGIDVDKWDYFARDCHHLGIRNNFDHIRFMAFTRVLKVEGELQICCRQKEVENIYGMFHTRIDLHKRAYQHKTKNIIEVMIVEAMKEANDHINIPGKQGELRKMSECIDDMEAYTKLHDGIFHQILYSTVDDLKPARDILQRIERRDLWKFIAHTQPINGRHNIDDEKRIKQEIEAEDSDNTLKDKIIVQKVKFNFGKKEKDPIAAMHFYSKNTPDESRNIKREQVSLLRSDIFSECVVRLYFKTAAKKITAADAQSAAADEQSMTAAKTGFEEWCKKKGFTMALQ